MEGNKATRLAECWTGATVTNQTEWELYSDWLIDRQARLRAAVEAVGGFPGAH